MSNSEWRRQPNTEEKRPDYSRKASAPYRFVPYDASAIALAQREIRGSEGTGRPDIATPLAEGLSARIKVHWIAETPLLIGVQAEEGAPVQPMRLGNHDHAPFMIPGATIRGAIRAVAEIAAAARLSQVNRNRLFGLRDFNHAALRGDKAPEGAALFPVSDARRIKAGWLSVRDEFRAKFASLARDEAAESALNGAFQITPCTWHSLTADDVGSMTQIPWAWKNLSPRESRPIDGLGFTKLSLHSKYAVTGATKNRQIAPETRRYKFRSMPGNGGPHNRVVPDQNGDISGHLVFSGKAPDGKKHEYVFEDNNETNRQVLPESMKRFRVLNSQAVDDKLKPLANWEIAFKALRTHPAMRIPIFYIGDLVTQPQTGTNAFFFGMTRFFKVPHRWAFEDVLSNSGVEAATGPFIPEHLDMVEALFGFVRETDDQTVKTAPDQLALRGRVAFSAALLAKGHNAEPGEPIETVMVGPKPSFAPFYLAADTKGFRDYSAGDTPRIAGRKRYPPRHPGATPQGALATISGQLRKQSENSKEMKMVSTLCFLLPGKDGGQLRFESEVRLTNVTKEELGLVLWALTFGGGTSGAPCRHMLGRAKPFGAGQMRVEIADLRVVWNSRQAPDGFGRGRQEPAGFTAAFEAQLHEALGDDSRRQAWGDAVRALRATANPAIGQAWDKAGKLGTMPVKNFQQLRDMVKPEYRGQNQAPREPVRIAFLSLA